MKEIVKKLLQQHADLTQERVKITRRMDDIRRLIKAYEQPEHTAPGAGRSILRSSRATATEEGGPGSAVAARISEDGGGMSNPQEAKTDGKE